MKAHEVEEFAADVASYGAAFWMKAAVFAVAWIAGMVLVRLQLLPMTDAGEVSPVLMISWYLWLFTPLWLWAIHAGYSHWASYLKSLVIGLVVSIPGMMASYQAEGLQRLWFLFVIGPVVLLVLHWMSASVRERLGFGPPKPSGAHGTARVGDRADVDQHTDLERAAW